MNRGNVLVVTVDGLRASALGAYGNATFATPALDSFAAESFLLDYCFAPAAELRDVFRALWHGVHPLRPPAADASASALPQYFAQQGYRTTLITDDSQLTSFDATRQFDQCVDLASSARSDSNLRRTMEIEQTGMAHLFAAACGFIKLDETTAVGVADSLTARSPRMLWVHSRGMYGPWDAPIDLQRTQLDEGDPPPLETVAPPDLALTEADDPDTMFRYSCAYAAQVMVLDACWSALMDSVATRPKHEPWLVVLTGARGFPLGEHQRIGGVDDRQYGEQLHVPLMLRFPDRLGRLARSSALASHVDLLPTLAAWIESTERFASPHGDGLKLLPLLSSANAPWRDAVLSTSATSASLRTAAWCLRQTHASSATHQETIDTDRTDELYVRPDDRWEANDVAKLCPDVVDTLRGAAAEISHRLNRNDPLPVQIVPQTAVEG